MAIPSGEIYLLNNVPIMADYQHTFDFDDRNQQFSYWRGYVKHTLSNYTYVRKEREYLSVELTMNQLEDVNYMIFRPANDERWYYAFVTDKRYSNPHSTEVFYSIDVMQTYMFDVKWKPSYIKQAHVDRWDADHKPIYSMTDEGLDYGSDYCVESGFKIEQDEGIYWALITLKDYSSLADEGLVIDNTKSSPGRSSFACAMMPFDNIPHTSESGSMFKWYDKTLSPFDDFIKLMLNSAIGNFVQSIVILPYNPAIFNLSKTDVGAGPQYTITENGGVGFATTTIDNVTMLMLGTLTSGQGVLAVDDWDLGLKDSLPTDAEWEELKAKPRTTKRDKRFESKLLCSPYRQNILTDWRTNPVVYKNEYMTTDKLEILYNYAFSHNAPFRYWVKDYKRDPEGRYTSLMQPMALELPVISDAYSTYLLENKNTIEANLQNAKISAYTNIGMSAVNGFVHGDSPAGTLIGGVSSAIMGAVQGAVNVGQLIRSENAKQQDIQNKPDTLINSTDSAFNVNDKNTGISFYRMKICCENEEILSEIFNMTGYKVNRVEIPNTRSRVRFNFIQTGGANVVGSINQSDLMKIREIYDRGITLWHYSEKDFNPLDYSYENIEVNLL